MPKLTKEELEQRLAILEREHEEVKRHSAKLRVRKARYKKQILLYNQIELFDEKHDAGVI